MIANDRARVLAVVAASPLSKSQVLAELGISRRTYYNWVRRKEAKQKTLQARKEHNQKLRELDR